MKHIYAACFSLLLISIFKEDEAATSIAPNATHPDHPGRCYYAGPPVTLIYPGESIKHPTNCASMFCRKDFTISFATCGVSSIPEPCWIVPGDESKPHPHCCPEILC